MEWQKEESVYVQSHWNPQRKKKEGEKINYTKGGKPLPTKTLAIAV
jgi:hypothetical protein